ncbi:unnamed protein product [Phaeothamnion confervicola]
MPVLPLNLLPGPLVHRKGKSALSRCSFSLSAVTPLSPISPLAPTPMPPPPPPPSPPPRSPTATRFPSSWPGTARPPRPSQQSVISELLTEHGLGDMVGLQTWSRDAGSFYCNDAYYRTLHAVRSAASRGFSVPAIFVHLPGPAVMGPAVAAKMVKYVAEAMMIGTIGLLPQ